MRPALHITNGDAFTSVFNTLGIQGTVITWREMLCEGKTLHHIGSEAFWKERYMFLNTYYKIQKKSFIDLTLREYRKLCKQKQQDEIVLWFESDLFCQINMLGLLSWLKNHRGFTQISLVSNPLSQNSESAKSFGDLSKEQLVTLYNQRIFLTQDDVEFADYAWQLYCSDNPIRISQLSNFEEFNLPYLKNAFQLHLKRFPSLANGLNAQENALIELAQTSNYANETEIIKSMLKNQGNLGYGDSQYERMLVQLKPLFSSFSPVKLKRIVNKIMQGDTNYYGKLKDPNLHLGGALKYAYLYDQAHDKILKL